MDFHHPGYAAGGHGNKTAVQERFQPLAEQYGVDLVINGHNHYYLRCVVNGIPHITTGGGGAPLYSPNMSAGYLAAAESTKHFTEIVVNGDDIKVVARRTDGTVIDTYISSDVPRPLV